jgi:hypothetical protein
MASKSNQNIFSQYCMSTRVPGHTCSALRRGVECTYAHTRDAINPRICKRVGGECRAKDRPFPNTCTFIHEGETKSEYSERVDFDRDYSKLSFGNVANQVVECDAILAEMKEKAARSFWHDSSTEADRIYFKRMNTSIRLLNTKRSFLAALETEKKKKLDEWARWEAHEDRRDKYREQYLESLEDSREYD